MPLGYWQASSDIQGSLLQAPDRVILIVQTSCILHNLIRSRQRHPTDTVTGDREDPNTHDLIPGTWGNEQQLLRDLGTKTTSL